jgi:hypothetical protein
MLGGLLPQLAQMIATDPSTTNFCVELLKFSAAPFRAGRSLDGSLDELGELMKAKGAQGKGDDPETAKGKVQLQIEQMKLTYARQKDDADRALKAQEMQIKAQASNQDNQIDAQAKQMEVQGRQQENNAKLMQIQADAQIKAREHEFNMREAAAKMQMDLAKHNMTLQQGQMKSQQAAAMANDRRQQQAFKATQTPQRGGGGPI